MNTKPLDELFDLIESELADLDYAWLDDYEQLEAPQHIILTDDNDNAIGVSIYTVTEQYADVHTYLIFNGSRYLGYGDRLLEKLREAVGDTPIRLITEDIELMTWLHARQFDIVETNAGKITMWSDLSDYL